MFKREEVKYPARLQSMAALSVALKMEEAKCRKQVTIPGRVKKSCVSFVPRNADSRKARQGSAVYAV